MSEKIVIGKGSRVRLVGEYRELLRDAFTAITGEAPKEYESCEALHADGGCTSDYDLTVAVGVDECKCSAAEGAREAIAAQERRSYFSPRFAIYCKEGRIVILYDRNEYTDIQGGEAAVKTFINRFIGERETLEFEEGLLRSGYYDLIEMQKLVDEVTKQEKWDTFRGAVYEKYGEDFGKRLVDAFASYYAIFRPELVEWYANLYEPSIGGLYAAASGRWHEGYLPMVEWTYRAMCGLEANGVFTKPWEKAIPKEMAHKIGYFAKSCQDPNGFFYHPQMIKAETDNAINSRGRNLGCGIAILSALGMKPTYPTQRDDPYDGISADEWWDSQVAAGEISPDEQKPFVPKSWLDYTLWREGKPTFKTKDEAMEHEHYEPPKQSAVAAATSTGDYLNTHKGFADYLDTKNMDAYPYSSGSELNGTYRLIKAASDRLGKCEEEGVWYSGMTLCEMTIDWLNRHITSTGLFGTFDENTDDPFAGCGYQNTNGLMKVIPIYSDWGVAYPKPLEAAKGCLMGVINPAPSTGNICEVYNIWQAFAGLIGNVKKFVPEDQREGVLAEIRNTLGDIGPDAVVNTCNKLRRYQKLDGGFSHNVFKGMKGFMGGQKVGIGLNEANVDANGFGVSSTIRAMLSCFEIGEYRPPMYYTWNYMKFIDIVLAAKPAEKKPVPENFL